MFLFLADNTLIYRVLGSVRDLLYIANTEKKKYPVTFPEGAEEEGGSCREGQNFQTGAVWFQPRLHGYSAVLQIGISLQSARLPRTPPRSIQCG